MAKAKYSKPASQVDLEQRSKDDHQPATVLNHGVDGELSDNGYVGVNPEYQNAASGVDAPVEPEGKTAESKLFADAVSEDAEFPSYESDDSHDEDEDEGKDETKSSDSHGSDSQSQDSGSQGSNPQTPNPPPSN